MNCTHQRTIAANAWLFDIQELQDSLAISTSTNQIHLVDKETLTTRSILSRAHDDVITGLACSANRSELFSVSRDGVLRCWDPRIHNNKPVRSYNAPTGILSVSHHKTLDRIAIGTEMKGNDCWVNIYDSRSPNALLSYSESHSEDVTSLYWHPTNNLLLSGGGDGIVNLFDTTVLDEDDAVLQVLNHGASVHIAQFLGKNEVMCISHMETGSLYQLSYAQEDNPRDQVREYGDLRAKVSTDYCISMDTSSTNPTLYCASNDGTFSAVPFDALSLDFKPLDRLDAAGCGTEVIRSVCRVSNALSHGGEVVYTASEDGILRAFGSTSSLIADEQKLQRRKERRESKLAERREKKRFEPY